MGFKPKGIEFKGLETLPDDAAKFIGRLMGKSAYTCGNCNYPIVFDYKENRPIRCTKCGEDIDWSESTKTKEIRYCPQCNRNNFDLNEVYCGSCPTKVVLKTKFEG